MGRKWGYVLMVENSQNEEKYGGNLNSVSTTALMLLLELAWPPLPELLMALTLLGLGLIKINTVLANFNNPRPSLILNN